MKTFQITGYTGKTPELKTSGDTTYTHLRVATRARNNRTDWFTIAVFGKLAEICAEYVRKGQVVAVSGDLRMSRYEERERVELIADKVDFFGRNGKGDGDGESVESTEI